MSANKEEYLDESLEDGNSDTEVLDRGSASKFGIKS